MPESGSAPNKTRELIEPPLGWARVDGLGEPANIFEVDPSRPDFPEKWRSREELRGKDRLARDPAMRAEIEGLRADFAGYNLPSLVEFVARGAEIREGGGDSKIAQQVGSLLEVIRMKVRHAVERSTTQDVPYTVALRYLCEQTLPVDLINYVSDEVPSPIKLTVNAETGKKLLMSIQPGEAILRFRGIARRDLNRIGHLITEAIDIQSPDRPKGGRSGRKAIDESPDDMATAELVARLFHWEGWSQRRIAAFLGWMKPADDWQDPKTRARVEQRVRRWLRIGETALAITPEDVEDVGDDAEDADWKRRPPQLVAAVRAEDRKRERR